MIILLAENSVVLSEHLTKIKTNGKKELSFISWERQNQIIDCIAQDISTTITTELYKGQLFSISIDSTIDFSRKEQTSFIVRYVDENTGMVYERLIAIEECAYTTGIDLFELFKKNMSKFNLNWTENLIGQSYDGAANMTGEFQGLQSHIKNIN
ncbi:general transcription factor II-I repeat domain-containing protein 2-like [Sipha flava]|uniref:General transcription factor II-I repeat domain-containing protein 2-like n=1 Tax=Sipha flava TaxID=143950 RepID=A0A2S2QDC4_9HEMI|nr:general transcription factor II-I repeat domain-containing protein 2-like [Sipha flava]